jgi:GNAT superfamily N-acetyltransferase
MPTGTDFDIYVKSATRHDLVEVMAMFNGMAAELGEPVDGLTDDERAFRSHEIAGRLYDGSRIVYLAMKRTHTRWDPVRDVPVGLLSMSVCPYVQHWKETRFVSIDGFYVVESCRNGSVALALIRRAKTMLKTYGDCEIQAAIHKRNARVLCAARRLGFDDDITIVSKRRAPVHSYSEATHEQ